MDDMMVLHTEGPIVRVDDYYPFGMTYHSSERSGFVTNKFLYNGKELQNEHGLDWYDYGARMYDAAVGRWFAVDLMAHLREWVSTYNFLQNSPLNRVDPTGALDNPIYDENGDFLGTDDKGLQGEAIVMNKEDFKQGMSHEDALDKGTLLSDVPLVRSSEFFEKIEIHHEGLSRRPDWDGHLTLDEANEWYRTGNGQPLFTDLSKVNLSGIFSLGESYVRQVKSFNLLLNSTSLNDGLVYGSITLKRYPNHQVRAFADEYNFEMHSFWNPLNWPRNVETVIGQKYAGEGQSFEINLYGSKKLIPILPWIK